MMELVESTVKSFHYFCIYFIHFVRHFITSIFDDCIYLKFRLKRTDP